jgi:hypothetical protein
MKVQQTSPTNAFARIFELALFLLTLKWLTGPLAYEVQLTKSAISLKIPVHLNRRLSR